MTDASSGQIQIPHSHVLDAEASAISEALFRKLDDDDSGYLSQRELMHARNVLTIGNDCMLQHGLLSETILHLLHDMDSDHDHWVDLTEWFEFTRSLFEIMGRRRFMDKLTYWTSSIHKKEVERAKTAKKHRRGIDPPDHARRRADHHGEIAKRGTSPFSITVSEPLCQPPRPHTSCDGSGSNIHADSPDDHGPSDLPLRSASVHDRPRPMTATESRTNRNQHDIHHSRSRDHRRHQTHKPHLPCIDNESSRRCRSLDARTRCQPVPPSSRGGLGEQANVSRSSTSTFPYPVRPQSGQGRGGGRSSCVQQRSRQNPPLTPEVVWEALTTKGAHVTTRIDVIDILDLFGDCKKNGLDMKLQSISPLSPDPFVIPEDLSTGEVGHLCMMLVEDPNLTEEDVRERIGVVKEQCRSLNRKSEVRDMLAAFYGRETSEPAISIGLFSKLISLISILMHIDRDCILLCMMWCELDWFELTDTLASRLLEKCSRKRMGPCCEPKPDDLWNSISGSLSSKTELPPEPIFDTANLRYNQHDWARFIHNCGIAFHNEGGQTNIYSHAIHRAYVEQRTRPKRRREAPTEHVKSHFAEALRPLQGRWEFERLIEELWKTETMRKDHASPLAMVTALIIKATEDPELMKTHADSTWL